ncbi:hypothetical protein A9264_05615 [Vibrio sp. UCD-FRSSP16_10]|uniref:BatD family protein n=1 Tax=unclassified Vibrio TaxID=2614977 RepID=UPI0007FC1FEB|nr:MULTISPECIES: BatD family protein [unclassified Vibrio]OBT07946.1 hypothetical protein A9260_07855 [Vibrio sp. UCD-FRSSP16_30]OBT17121.1 hypothetical protein A9264_05615 [Vibrio sp. UCD-FRSSP16_10]
MNKSSYLSKGNLTCLNKWLRGHVFMLILLIIPTCAMANDLQQAIDNNQLMLSAKLQSDSIVSKQQAIVDVELSSTKPFKQDMIIPYLDIKNALVKKDDQPIIRSAKTVDGQRWFIQKTKVYIYPLSEGTYQLAPFDISVALDNGNKEPLSGTISSKSIPLTATHPSKLNSKLPFVVGSNAQLTLTSDRPLDKSFYIGDAVVLTYQLEVKNSDMLLLPELTIPKIATVESYLKPVVKENVFDRLSKRNTAMLSQQVTIIFQQQGKLNLPALKMQWWDTTNNEVQLLSIEAASIQVGTTSTAVLSSNNTQLTELGTKLINQYWKTLISILIIVIFSTALFIKLRAKQKTSHALVKPTNHKKIIKQYHIHITQHNYAKAVECLYAIAGTHTFTQQLNPQALITWNQLLSLSFSDTLLNKLPSSEQPHTAKITTKQAQSLVQALTQPKTKQQKEMKFNWRLNP